MTERNDCRTGHHGVWITADGRIRVHLQADGRFDELHGDRAHHGTWRAEGNRIHFHDPDTGYRTTGEFRDGVLYADRCEFLKAAG